MRRFFVFLFVAPAILVAVIAAGIAFGGTGNGTTVPAPQLQTMVIRAGTGMHSPMNFAVRPDVPIRLTIVNHQAQAHVFAISELGVNQIVPPARDGVASRVIVTFTAPYGVYQWECAVCPEEHGDVYATVTRRGSHGTPPGGFHWDM